MTPRLIVLLLALGSLSAGCGAMAGSRPGSEFRAHDVTFESRGVPVPATFVQPLNDDDAPVVLMAHGHGGSRDEAGGFRRLAEELAHRGIASLRMDFAGCGDSTEPFVENRLTNMVADLQAGLEYARSQPGIDAARVAVVGYSMGARVAMLSLADGYLATVLWAPVGTNGPDSLYGLFGGREPYRVHRDRAYQDGSATFVTPWGQVQELGRAWFRDMESSRPLDAIASYPGPLLVVHGDADSIIPGAVAGAVAEAATSSEDTRLELVAGADHGLGFYSDDPGPGTEVIAMSVDFLVTNLLRTPRGRGDAF